MALRVLLYGKGRRRLEPDREFRSLTIDGALLCTSSSNGNWGFTGGVGIEWAFCGKLVGAL